MIDNAPGQGVIIFRFFFRFVYYRKFDTSMS